MARLSVVAISLVLMLTAAASASTRYDPRLRFRTISTPRFDIHYHQHEEAVARRLAALAEEVASEMDRTLGPASGRVQVILVDQTDLPNGWATPLPFNTIEITAAAPGSSGVLGNTRDWLRLVFIHEYTHIVHLSRGRGWIGGLRRVFGRMPLLYPNLYTPVWQIEGIATYEESARTGEGRVRDGSFRTLLDVAGAGSGFEPLDRASGGLVDWPSGHAPYLYGAYFHQFLARKYGTDALADLTRTTAGYAPYFGSLAFKKTFGQSLGDLWRDFEAASRRDPLGFAASTIRLTHHGFNVAGPRFGRDGRIYYSASTPHEFPSLRSIAAGEDVSRKLTNRYLGDQIGFAGARLIFDEIQVENHVGLQSDLYAISPNGDGRVRLTRGARAREPDVSPEGTTIVCTIQRADRRELATIALSGDRVDPPATLLSEPGVSFGSPRWSPDGRSIAVERSSGDVVVVDRGLARVVRTVSIAGATRTITPAWTPDGSLVVSADREGDGFRIYRIDAASRTWLLDGTGPDARSPDISPDGQTLVFVGYTAAGYDLFAVPMASARWIAVEDAAQTPAPPTATPVRTSAETPTRPYSPWRTIAPRSWLPTIETDAEEVVVGAATSSADALGRHAYAVEAGWSTGRGRPDWQAAYAYDRWWPTLFANVADDTDPWRGGEVRTREANAGVLLPFRRVRRTQSILGAFHASTDRFTCGGCPSEIARRSLRGGWRLNASRAFGYSISPEEGWNATSVVELTRRGLGADGDAGAAIVDLRGYVPFGIGHGVIAGRIAGARTWGDDRAQRVFSASGSGPQPGRFSFGSDAIGLLRGVDEDALLGRRAIVGNLDYRFPVWRLDRGAGTLPIFARVLHGAVFVDTGHAWDRRFRASDLLASIGAEISLDAVVGYRLPLTLTTGAAWVSRDRGVTAFGRIGRAF
jgi:hypothetical protein